MFHLFLPCFIGPPTLTGTECLIENFNICMAVRFYSADEDITVHWFRNDIEVEISERVQVLLFPAIVQLNYTNKQIQEEGYTSKLCILEMTLSEVEPYSCQILNNYGSIEYSFKKDHINQVYQHLSDVLSTMVTGVRGEPDQNEEQYNIITIGKVLKFNFTYFPYANETHITTYTNITSVLTELVFIIYWIMLCFIFIFCVVSIGNCTCYP